MRACAARQIQKKRQKIYIINIPKVTRVTIKLKQQDHCIPPRVHRKVDVVLIFSKAAGSS